MEAFDQLQLMVKRQLAEASEAKTRAAQLSAQLLTATEALESERQQRAALEQQLKHAVSKTSAPGGGALQQAIAQAVAGIKAEHTAVVSAKDKALLELRQSWTEVAQQRQQVIEEYQRCKAQLDQAQQESLALRAQLQRWQTALGGFMAAVGYEALAVSPGALAGHEQRQFQQLPAAQQQLLLAHAAAQQDQATMAVPVAAGQQAAVARCSTHQTSPPAAGHAQALQNTEPRPAAGAPSTLPSPKAAGAAVHGQQAGRGTERKGSRQSTPSSAANGLKRDSSLATNSEGDAPKPKQARRAQQEQQVQLREPPLASGGEQPPSAPNSSAAAAPLLSPSAATFNTSGAAHVLASMPEQQRGANGGGRGAGRTRNNTQADVLRCEDPVVWLNRNIRSYVNQFCKNTAFHVFRDPVPADTPGYFDVITHPMDLGTIAAKAADEEYMVDDEFHQRHEAQQQLVQASMP
ncbi:hypothetical protein N2152v2_006901 [Parachlorella kessleri]